MGQPIEISRTPLSAAALRAVAGKCDNGAVVRRLLAVALLLEGQIAGRRRRCWKRNDPPTLRDWVHRYNAAGVEGLRSRTGPGRPPFLTEARMEELQEVCWNGREPERHTVIRWRCVDLCAEIAGRWSWRLRADHGNVAAAVGNDPFAAASVSSEEGSGGGGGFWKNYSVLVKAALLGSVAGKPIEIRCRTEARVGQQGSLEYIWAPIGWHRPGRCGITTVIQSICSVPYAQRARPEPR